MKESIAMIISFFGAGLLIFASLIFAIKTSNDLKKTE